MQVRTSLRAAATTHQGLVRDHNEDRFHYDPERGIFMVVDGVGGQAAGEKAAEAAVARLRERLERESGPVELRLREAITDANNEIFRLARSRPDWEGMACVLTCVVVDGNQAVVGHVGDTRLYKIRAGRIQKLTRDHSPVGEREDAGELSEAEAMRHPRRNEVYRDVGSELHRLDDAGFIDTFAVPFESDAALLICSDGLSDLVNADTIRHWVEAYAGHPFEVTRALIEAANDAGGKDNVTAVYIEGPRFAEGEDTGAVRSRKGTVRETRAGAALPPAAPSAEPVSLWGRVLVLSVLLATALAWAAYHAGDLARSNPVSVIPVTDASTVTVNAGESIGAAIAAARQGTVIMLEPGEYREAVRLKSGVHLRSRVPRGATLRLPGSSAESDAALSLVEISDVEVRGLRIVGDAATPLGVGVQIERADAVLMDIEIQGARSAAVSFGPGSGGTLLGSDLHDNPGIALDVRNSATPRIISNQFARNATGRATGPIIVEPGARPVIDRNVFVGMTQQALVIPPGLPAGSVGANWFIPAPRTPAGAPPRERRGRQ